MNKVTFILLLTLSVCFSSPATDPLAKAAQVATSDTKTTLQPETKVPEAHPENVPQSTPDHTNDATKHIKPNMSNDTKHTEPPVINKNATQHLQPATNNTTKPDATIPEVKTTVAPPTNDTKHVVTDKTSTVVTSTTKPDAHNVVPAGKDDKTVVSTEKTASSTDKPSPTEAPHPHEVVLQSRGFDGPSFFGGIILTLGMFAIGFIGFKYYKSQSERNYHTL